MSVGIMKDKKNKDKIPPIVVSLCLIVYYIVYFALLITVLPGIFKYLLGIIPIIFSIVIIKVCKDRIKEIERGESDDLSQY